MQSFTLDLKTLLQILSRQKQTGVLRAEISSEKLHLNSARQLMHADLLLENGMVQTCTIVTMQARVVVERQKALELLFAVGVTNWHWEIRTVKEVIPTERMVQTELPELSSSGTFVPHRTALGEEVLPTLPRDYRKILALIDGQRTVRKLAVMLSMHDEDVVAVLHMLQSRGLLS